MSQNNQLQQKFENGDVILGAQSITHESSIIEIYGNLGLDFVWIDFEHIGPAAYDSGIFEDLTRAAEVAKTELLVRLSNNEPALIRKVLDSGVRNILIPRIETAEEVKQAVEASRFSYGNAVGERGIAASRVSGWGSKLDRSYVEREDENTSVGVMIENTTAVENLDEILQVEELGFIVIGPADLSVSLGHPLETDHPEVEATIDEIRETSKSFDIPVGRLASSATEAQEMINNGVQLLRISSGEIAALRSVVGPRLEKIKEST